MSGECDCAGCQRIAELDADRGGLAAHLVTLSQDLERVTDERDDLRRQLDEAVAVAGQREERLRELEARLPLVDKERDEALRERQEAENRAFGELLKAERLEKERDTALRDAERLTVQRETLANAIVVFVTTVDAAVRHFETRGRGGMQVPFFGDFASASPSVVRNLEWWARFLREALAEAKAPPTNDLLTSTNSSRSASPPVPRDANGTPVDVDTAQGGER